MPVPYRRRAAAWVARHLADLPAPRRRALTDELASLLEAGDGARYGARQAYLRDHARGRKAGVSGRDAEPGASPAYLSGYAAGRRARS